MYKSAMCKCLSVYVHVCHATEFEGLYWAEQKARKQQRAKDARTLVSAQCIIHVYKIHVHVHVHGHAYCE